MAVPVSLDDAKRQLRIHESQSEFDEEVAGFIADAAEWVEAYTGHIFSARNVTETFRGFGAVTLRAWPIKSTAAPGVAYVDATGSPIAITGARLDLSRQRARILPPSGFFSPFVDSQQLFTVTIRAGYEDGDEVPRNLRRAMLVLIGAYQRAREGGEVLDAAEASARSLCRRFKVHAL